jgi:prepilin-type N-terminal cleavage/methylation domain-containing protein
MRGFTLIELMIVVVIVGVLGAVAVYAYRKQVNRAREAEVMAMLGEMRAKEEAYKTEMGTYQSTNATSDENQFHPVLGVCGVAGQVEPCPKAVDPRPAEWTRLGLNPHGRQLYCGYVAVAGIAGATLPAGSRGAAMLGTAAQPAPWFYMRAMCDLKRTNVLNAEWWTAMNTTSVASANEGM